MSNKFDVTDYRGRNVFCSRSAWYGHLTNSGHSIMYGNEEAVKDSIEDPDSVYKSKSHDNREVFFKESTVATYHPLLTKTVVEYNEDNIGEVVTTFVTSKEKGGIGDAIYKRSDN